MTVLTTTNHPAAVIRDGRGFDMRVLIYHAAMHRRPDYRVSRLIARLQASVVKRPQLVAIHGRPC